MPFQFGAPTLATVHQFGMTILSLAQIAGGTVEAAFHVFMQARDALIFAIDQFGKRKIDMARNPFDFG